MEDRYAGDVGDFLKFGLLRALGDGAPPLKLGVNWYLTGEESHNADGKYVGYLQPGTTYHVSLRSCDPDLMSRLAQVVSADRSVAALEKSGVLPEDSVTYSARLVDRMARGWAQLVNQPPTGRGTIRVATTLTPVVNTSRPPTAAATERANNGTSMGPPSIHQRRRLRLQPTRKRRVPDAAARTESSGGGPGSSGPGCN